MFRRDEYLYSWIFWSNRNLSLEVNCFQAFPNRKFKKASVSDLLKDETTQEIFEHVPTELERWGLCTLGSDGNILFVYNMNFRLKQLFLMKMTRISFPT